MFPTTQSPETLQYPEAVISPEARRVAYIAEAVAAINLATSNNGPAVAA